MPRKNSIKTYVEGGYYHLYNRGVEKRIIFLDDKDYIVFLYFLKKYMVPDEGKVLLNKENDLSKKINLLAYCLLPNHFHLLVKQKTIDGITQLMNRIATNYVMYFNKKYKRVGGLFQSVYKAVLIENDNQFIHLSRYIHLNPYPEIVSDIKMIKSYKYSSYGDYLGTRNTEWVDKNEILNFFAKNKQVSFSQARKENRQGYNFNSYQSFVEDFIGEFDLPGLTLEENPSLIL